MNTEQRERKSRLRERWLSARHFFEEHPTYMQWLEERYDYQLKAQEKLNAEFLKLEKCIDTFADYIHDMENGMQEVEKAAIAMVSTVDTRRNPVQQRLTEDVWAAVVWLRNIVLDSRLRFLGSRANLREQPVTEAAQ